MLLAVGRSPNGKKIGADKAGVAVTDRGFIPVDNQMRTNVPHIFAIGDIIGQPMLAHKAVHEGHVAAEVAAGEKSFFDARVIPSVAYTDPEIAWVGITEDEAKAKGVAIQKGLFPWAASGRAIANGRDEGFTKLLFDEATHRIVGGGIVGTHAGDLIGEIALAIEMGADAVDIGKTIHPHPTLCESVGLAAEVFEGVCTDLPPATKEIMTQDEQKRLVAREAIKYVIEDAYIGVGSGSTANYFIDELAKMKRPIRGAVASSVKTAERLKQHGIPVVELTDVNDLPVYIDGADETTAHGAMIKGGGGALTREKIVAAVARKFVCIIDRSKLVGVLGNFPLPVEVIPMARGYVAHELVRLGGQPQLREHFFTDNGNIILDVEDLTILNPAELEAQLNQHRRRGHQRAVRATRRRCNPGRHRRRRADPGCAQVLAARSVAGAGEPLALQCAHDEPERSRPGFAGVHARGRRARPRRRARARARQHPGQERARSRPWPPRSCAIANGCWPPTRAT